MEIRMRKLLFISFCVLAFGLSCHYAEAQQAEGKKAPQLVAHRGGRYEAEENTMPAFSSALTYGITGFELDVHMTADGKYVVMHDFDVSRMVNAEGTIENMNYRTLRALRTKKGNRIPSLDEVLELFGRHPGLYVEFEMKTSREDLYPADRLARYAEDVWTAVTRACPQGSTYILSSFDTRVIKYIKEHHHETEVMYITADGNTEETRSIAKAAGATRMACHRTRTTLEQMRIAHKEGMLINLWPNADSTDIALSLALGADFICTDIPRAACDFIDRGDFTINK